ncbi:MAG: hypothetical protein OXU70_20640, partial [Gammaproteobacteria bacterium]|nr:hypothetical protein [Gammaproteobacteria bacterium]
EVRCCLVFFSSALESALGGGCFCARNPAGVGRCEGVPPSDGAKRRLLLSILKRRGGWAMDDLPLELEAGDDLEALLRLWRCPGRAAG